ncbi:hypothetical protein JXB31_02440 [Candidatus Woesearchaeota archaeon]|nr:hypothetical protein [Candidatus Woesearchaeota archaeon]
MKQGEARYKGIARYFMMCSIEKSSREKRGDMSLSLNTVIGLVLAVMALLAISAFISGLFDVFIDREKEGGVMKGFMEFYSSVESLKTGESTELNLQLSSDYVVVGFNPGVRTLEGECREPMFPRTIKLQITRDVIHCPMDEPCICLCSAQKISWIYRVAKPFEYINCENAVCKHYTEDKQMSFMNPEGCDMPLVFSSSVEDIVISKSLDSRVSFKKK